MAAARVQQPASSLALEVEGNAIALLPDGPERLDALLALIEGAQRDLRVLYYTFSDDEAGHRVREALLAACARGVQVAILIDGFGSQDVPDSFFEALVESKCRFCRFEPRWGRRYLLRNHQKMALADDRIVLAGGFNVSDDYFGTAEAGAWRDLGFRVEGAAVACLVDYFEDLFRWARTKHGRLRGLRRLLNRHSQKQGKLRWLFGGPVARLSPWTRVLRADMHRARRIDLIAAYFAPNYAMLRRIARIARRDDARVVTAAKSDNGATIGAARHTYWGLLRRGVGIFEYQPTKLHTKLIVIDDIVHIGSANFDMRSLYLNLEMMLRIEDKAMADKMRTYVDGEIDQCHQITIGEHDRQRSWFNRLIWSLCYFVVATMDYTVTRRLNFGVESR